MRIITIIDDKFASCSCGLPARKKIPCRHLISVLGDIHPCMFGIRWLNLYQLCFQRKGHKNLSGVFRALEDEEFSRDWEMGKHVYVRGFEREKTVGPFPLPIGNTTKEDVQTALKLKYWLEKGRVHVRGEPLLDIPTDHLNNDNDVATVDLSLPIGETTVFLSQDTLQMLDDDKMFAANKEKSSIQLTQEKQQISVNSLMQSNVSTDEVAISTVRNTLKKLEGHPDLISDYQNSLEELDNKLVQKRTNNTDGNNQYSTIYNNSSKRVSLCSPMTGVNTKKKEQRKKLLGFL